MIKNKKGDKIVEVTHQEASYSRFGIQNQTTGYNDIIYINANWPFGSVNDEWTTPVPAINTKDRYKVPKFQASKDKKAIYPLSFPFPGNMVYQLPNWHSIFPSKWFDVAVQIPILKAA